MKAKDFSGIRNKGPLPDPKQVKVPADSHDLLNEYADSAVSLLEELEAIRQMENEHGIAGLDSVKVIMTTALDDSRSVMGAFKTGGEAYLIKPFKKDRLLEEMEKLGLVSLSESSTK